MRQIIAYLDIFNTAVYNVRLILLNKLIRAQISYIIHYILCKITAEPLNILPSFETVYWAALVRNST